MFTSTNPDAVRPIPGLAGPLAPRVVESIAAARPIGAVASLGRRERERRGRAVWLKRSFEDYLSGNAAAEETPPNPEKEREAPARPEVEDPTVGGIVDVRA